MDLCDGMGVGLRRRRPAQQLLKSDSTRAVSCCVRSSSSSGVRKLVARRSASCARSPMDFFSRSGMALMRSLYRRSWTTANSFRRSRKKSPTTPAVTSVHPRVICSKWSACMATVRSLDTSHSKRITAGEGLARHALSISLSSRVVRLGGIRSFSLSPHGTPLC